MASFVQRARAGFQEATSGRGVFVRLRRLVEDRRGVGAIEFAIVAPILVMTYVGAFEITVGITMARKVSRASSNVSDLLTRTATTDKATLDSMKAVTKSVLAPFTQNYYSLKMTGVAVDASGNATVAWSRGWSREVGEDKDKVTVPYAKGSAVELPDDADVKGSFIVRTEFTVPHSILLMASSLESRYNKITLGKTSYFRPRVGDNVACSDC